ncbi:S8 family serine peptidase [Aquimarina sp. ERC-38]|uniref:S8 family serine peptidase n=1 Tax=Aquimarina sp. ERC-38 TaxID=2949996 RepID=UPI00224531A4|nr:S8 family serine peptidase [Aquimarina sp. ERC-38]UZO82178.1 S8 family serine peptidase [Aquimarina sp. ERC-38]
MNTINKAYLTLIIFGLFILSNVHSQNKHSNTLHKDCNIPWYFKDFKNDSIVGISWQKLISEKSVLEKIDTIIVAVIDTKFDIFHQDIKNQVWTNKKETKGNHTDDDGNGYVDDINGWNFLGGKLSNKHISDSNFESVRILRKYNDFFNKKYADTISVSERWKYEQFKLATNQRAQEIANLKEDLEYGNVLNDRYWIAKDTVAKIFGNSSYTLKELDSLYQKTEKENDSVLKPLVYFMRDFVKYDLNEQWILEQKSLPLQLEKTSYSQEYDERYLIGDTLNELGFKDYGNHEVYNDSITFQHAISIAGIIAGQLNCKEEISGFSEKFKLMPIVVAPTNGDEHDKDIALGIRYAVDNGAKVINMSFGKPLSLYKTWVDDALKYAEEKDVLIIASSGNEGKKIGDNFEHYPDDHNNSSEHEIVSNFVKVGSTSKKINNKLLSSFSNYSKKHVDLFATGSDIALLAHQNSYKRSSGTSFSTAIVSGVAAVIRSIYPNLTASQVKKVF